MKIPVKQIQAKSRLSMFFFSQLMRASRTLEISSLIAIVRLLILPEIYASPIGCTVHCISICLGHFQEWILYDPGCISTNFEFKEKDMLSHIRSQKSLISTSSFMPSIDLRKLFIVMSFPIDFLCSQKQIKEYKNLPLIANHQ